MLDTTSGFYGIYQTATWENRITLTDRQKFYVTAKTVFINNIGNQNYKPQSKVCTGYLSRVEFIKSSKNYSKKQKLDKIPLYSIIQCTLYRP